MVFSVESLIQITDPSGPAYNWFKFLGVTTGFYTMLVKQTPQSKSDFIYVSAALVATKSNLRFIQHKLQLKHLVDFTS